MADGAPAAAPQLPPSGPSAATASPMAVNLIHAYLEEHFDEVFDILVRLAWCVCPWRDPQDVAAEVIAKLWERADQFDPVCEPWPWIRQAAVNAAIDARRHVGDQPHVRVVVSGDLPSGENIEAHVLDNEVHGAVRRVVHDLTEDERDLLRNGFGRGRPRKALLKVLVKIVAAVRGQLRSDVPLAEIARHLHVVLEEIDGEKYEQ